MYTSLLTEIRFVDEELHICMKEASEWLAKMDDSYVISDVLIRQGYEDSLWSINILLYGAYDKV